MATSGPPFRAGQVGSLLRPAPLKEARARREGGEITRGRARRRRGRRDRARGPEAGGDRAPGRDGRGVPALVVALRLPQGTGGGGILPAGPGHPAIDEAARFAPLEQLALSPQCGFASTEEDNLLTEADQWANLGLIVEIAADVWR